MAEIAKPAHGSGGEHDGETRRDFLFLTAAAMGAVGAAAVAWPLIDTLNPAADVLALASIDVDLSPVEVGQAITVTWRGKPVFIRHRTKEEIDAANAVDPNTLPDPSARNEALPESAPASDTNRTKAGKEQWLVMVGICTHLGCIPKGQGLSDVKGDYNGWFCVCHGSHYDTAGRIRRGPAPRNLEVPSYEFLTDTMIKIG